VIPYRSARFRGSVITPVSAEATAVSGEQRYTMSSRVPDRPGKLRGVVRREITSVAGAWPIPMQPLQPAWWIRPPEVTRWYRCPSRIRSARIDLDDGLTSNDTSGWMRSPAASRMAAVTAKSR
jgi:hypothetical protein